MVLWLLSGCVVVLVGGCAQLAAMPPFCVDTETMMQVGLSAGAPADPLPVKYTHKFCVGPYPIVR